MRNREESAKSVVSVAEMARIIGLSRSRFYQLVIAGVFPRPCRDDVSGRPYYDGVSQQACRTVRAKNCGINGQPVLFYSRRVETKATSTRSAKRATGVRPRPTRSEGGSTSPRLSDALKQLGLSSISDPQVAAAIAVCFPAGIAGRGHDEVLLSVFRHLVRRDSGENVGR